MGTIRTLLILCFIVICTNALSQVKNIKETSRDDKKTTIPNSDSRSYSNSSSSFSANQSFGESLGAGIISGIFKGFCFITVEAQKAALQNRDKIPNLISLETNLDYGTNFEEITFNPSIRANWGIFASDFRYSLLHDNTGSLQSLDWQVLVARIPIKTLKLNYGIGFTSLLDPKITYFESSTGFDLNICESRLNIMANYRWTARKDEERYRQEFKFTTDYQIMNNGVFHLSPMIGITYQEYFKKDRYMLFNVGVKIRISGDLTSQ